MVAAFSGAGPGDPESRPPADTTPRAVPPRETSDVTRADRRQPAALQDARSVLPPPCRMGDPERPRVAGDRRACLDRRAGPDPPRYVDARLRHPRLHPRAQSG